MDVVDMLRLRDGGAIATGADSLSGFRRAVTILQ